MTHASTLSWGKRLLAMAIALAMLLAYLPAGSVPHVHAETTEETQTLGSGTCGDNLNWVLYSTGELVISGTGPMTDYAAKEDVPWYAISFGTKVTSVTISSGVTHIGDHAFDACSSMISASIPESVTTIGNYAFYNCVKLPSVTLPSQLTSIGARGFGWCRALGSIVIPDTVTDIAGGAFWYCTSLTSVTMSNGIINIGDNAFGDCARLDYNSYDNAYYLGNAANPYIALIGANSGITTCNIHEDTRVIASYAFENIGITSIVIPDSVVAIDGAAFRGCSQLTHVLIGSGVAHIDTYAFYSSNSKLNHVLYKGSEEQWNSIQIGEDGNSKLFDSSIIWTFNATSEELQNGYCKQCCTHYWNGDDTCDLCGVLCDHLFDNACDNYCERCGTADESRGHNWSNRDGICAACGDTCENWGGHYTASKKHECRLCGKTLTSCTYDNDCDTDCNVCGAVRTVNNHVSGAAYPCQTGSCIHCGATVPAADHSFVNGKCECGFVIVYFINSKFWSNVYAYVWTADPLVTWPGAAIEKTGAYVNGFDIYAYIFDEQYANIIFNDGSGVQTPDLTVQAGKYYDFASGTWYASLDDVPEVTYYLRGSMNGWGTEAPMTPNADGTYSVTITVNAGTYEYKAAVADWSWTCPGSNAEMTLEKDSVVTFTLNPTAYTVTYTAVCVDHSYDNLCDADCNDCGATRQAPHYPSGIACNNKCTVCGVSLGENADHSYEYACSTICSVCFDENRPDAVCVTSGSVCEDGNCIYCGKEMPAKKTHSYSGQTTKDATCEEDGEITYTCSNCGGSYIETITALGHAYDDNCDTDCSTCGTARKAPHNPTPNAAACSVVCMDCLADISTADHSFAYACSPICSICQYNIRDVTCQGEYACSPVCQYCGTNDYWTATTHYFPLACDTVCEFGCGTTREASHESDSKPCEDGHCVYCGEPVAATADHTWSTGMWSVGSCDVCGTFCEHSYTYPCSQKCAICTKTNPNPADHINDAEFDCQDGTCTVCGNFVFGNGHVQTYSCSASCAQCSQVIWPDAACQSAYPSCKDGYCIYCNKEMAATDQHNWTDGYCTVCITFCEHDYGDWIDGKMTCVICKYVINCTHDFENDCDADCGTCGLTREPTHYRSPNAHPCYDLCSVCQKDFSTAEHQPEYACSLMCSVCDSYVRTERGCVGEYLCSPVCKYCGTAEYWTGEEHAYTTNCDTNCKYCDQLTRPDPYHDAYSVDYVAPTCTTSGNDFYWYCPTCDSYWVDVGLRQPTDLESVTLDATGHSMIFNPYNASTSACLGNKAHYACTECFGLYWDEAGEQPTTYDEVTIPITPDKSGDADGDGFVDAYDASLIKKYSVGAILEIQLNLRVLDLDGDGFVDAYDASLIQKYSVGAIDKFPVQS